MRERKWGPAVVVCLSLLLFFALTAALLGVSFHGVRVIPAEEGVRFASGETWGLYSPSYWVEIPLDPTELYNRVARQTVYIEWEEKNEKGEKTGTMSGTGIIASHDGYILTNSHVVIDAKKAGEKVTVELYDGTKYEGTILGADPETEVALLKIEARGLSAAELGSSRYLKQCQQVYAIGNPAEEMKFSVTSGIISGLDRYIPFDDGTVLHMFQFDAAINPGSSGGPVYDDQGHVVGIVTAKYALLTSEGIGLAILMDDVLPIAEELKEYGYVRGRPLIGITVKSIEENRIVEGSPAGAFVHSAEPGLAGERAGLKAGDIIVELNGKSVTGIDSLNEAKTGCKAGDTVTVRFWRGGEYAEAKLTFDEVTPEHPTGAVTIEEPEEETEEAAPAEGTPEGETPPEEAPGEGGGAEAQPEA